MATIADLLTEAFEHVRDTVHAVLDGMSDDQLATRLDDDANSTGWLVWHLTRVQDDHITGVAGGEQVWTRDGWSERLDLPFGAGDIGYGHSSSDVAEVRLSAADLRDYHDAVHARTVEYVGGLHDADLDRVVDESWDRPVTLGVRLLSVVNDDLQHAGQAAFVRGVVERHG